MSQFLTAKKSVVIQIPATVNMVFVSAICLIYTPVSFQPEMYEVTAFFSVHFPFMFSVLKKCLTLLFLEHSTGFSKQISRKLVGKSREHLKWGPKHKLQPVLEYGSSVWDPQRILLQDELEKVQMSVTTFPVVINYCHCL